MFTRQERIRFQHCDPAGIVFYPRYTEMVNATVEDWFSDHIGIGFAELHGPLRLAIPVATLTLTFQRPSRLGEVLDMTLTVERRGTSSLGLRIVARMGDEPRFEATLTLVQISQEDYRPRPWIPAILSRLG